MGNPHSGPQIGTFWMVKYRRLEEPDNDLTYAEEIQQTHGEEPATNPD